MGPSILFDKSAIQSLGQQALYEANRYSYTVIPPVLLLEILADLSLESDDPEVCRAKVANLSRRVMPSHSKYNVHYWTMCVADLLGEHVPMDRVPVIGGAKTVVTEDGSKGVFTGVQPENEAVLRWRSGDFTEDDVEFAVKWRENARGMNLEAIRNELPKPPSKLRTLEHVTQFADIMLTDPESQEPLLRWFLNALRCNQQTFGRVCFRWQLAAIRSLRAFAPYAVHCLRAQIIFYVGMTHGILSTRSSNIVDLEYLYYTPFASVFCSGDKLHRQLAPFILQEDQSFVDRQEFLDSLNVVATSRKDAASAEPGEDSLIRQLWLKHWKKPPPQAAHPTISEKESQRIMESVEPIMEAIREQAERDQERPSGPRFPV